MAFMFVCILHSSEMSITNLVGGRISDKEHCQGSPCLPHVFWLEWIIWWDKDVMRLTAEQNANCPQASDWPEWECCMLYLLLSAFSIVLMTVFKGWRFWIKLTVSYSWSHGHAKMSTFSWFLYRLTPEERGLSHAPVVRNGARHWQRSVSIPLDFDGELGKGRRLPLGR
jgi:hypothetical protein